jgi:hypothetical protein
MTLMHGFSMERHAPCGLSLWLALSLIAALGTPAPAADDAEAARLALQKAATYLEDTCRRQPDGLPAKPLQASGSGSSRTERWGSGHLGNNAIVLLALLRSGKPEDDSAVAQIAARLERHIADWGVPDAMWDTAWLAAAFVNLQAPRFSNTRDRLLSRIVDAQLTKGKAKGMWGPLCINTGLLSDLLAYEKRLTGGQDDRVKSADPATVAKTLQALTNFYPNVSQQALRFRKATRPQTLTDAAGGTVRAEGLPYAPYNQVFADMESTALAIIALTEAERNGCLPEKTARPSTLSGPPVVPPRQSRKALSDAVDSIAARAGTDSRWNACNLHEEAGPFPAYEGAAFVPELKGDLASEPTFETTATAFTALLRAARATGSHADTLLRKNARLLAAARGHLLDELPVFLTAAEANTADQAYVTYKTLLQVAGISRRYGTSEVDRPEAAAGIVDTLLRLQNSDGSWGARPRYSRGTEAEAVADTSSLKAWRTGFRKRTGSLSAGDARKLELKLLDYMCARATQTEESSLRLLSTSFAVFCLADLAVPRIAGYVPDATRPAAPRYLQRAVGHMSTQSGKRLDVMRVAPKSIGTLAGSLPLLAVDGSETLLSEEVCAGLADYVTSGGRLIVAQESSARSSKVERAIRKGANRSRVAILRNGSEFMADFRGTRPGLRALYLEDGRMAGVFLPPASAGTAPERSKITASQAIQTTYLLLRDAIDRAEPGREGTAPGDSQGTKE